MIIIYLLKNTVNTKVYVGQTCQTLKERFRYGWGYKDCTYLNHAIEKHGSDKFYYEVITFCSTQKSADYLEEYFIAKYDSRNPEKGYNISIGGSSPMKGRKHTKETIEKMSKSHKGQNTWMKGKTNFHSEEHKAELSKQMKGNKLWLLAPSNQHHLLKWIKEVHTKIHKEEYPILIDKYNSGATFDDLAKQYGVHVATIRDILKGKVKKRSRKVIPIEKHIDIMNIYNSGITPAEIAKLYNVHVCTIHRIIRQYRK